MSLKKLEKIIFQIYIFVLPIMMLEPFRGIKEAIGALAVNNNFFLFLVGMTLIIIDILVRKKNFKTNKLLNYLFLMILCLNFSTIIMAIILNQKLGYLHGEDTYSATIGMIILYFQVFFIFYYNYRGFQLVSIKDVERIFKYIISYTLIVGYFQITMIHFPLISGIYDFFNILGAVRESSFILTINRISLTGSEPSSTGAVISLIIFPYLLAKTLYRIDSKTIILIILFLPIILYAKSSTALIMFSVNILLYCFLLFKQKGLAFRKFIIISLLFLVGLTGVTFGLTSSFSKNSFLMENYYLLFDKISDESNQSTLYRTSTIINDIEVFKKYPILGIGNGNQGFYYNENIKSNYFISQEVQNAYSGKVGVVNGGPFVPAYISGYGIVGILLLIIFIIKSYRKILTIKNGINYFYEMYIISSITFLLTATMTHDIVGNYIAIFILSFPFMKQLVTIKD